MADSRPGGHYRKQGSTERRLGLLQKDSGQLLKARGGNKEGLQMGTWFLLGWWICFALGWQ